MVKTIKRFRKFLIDDHNDLAEYEQLLQDPLCEITCREVEKEKLNEYNENGQLIRHQERIYYLVHWTEKVM